MNHAATRAAPLGNAPELTVSELSQALKRTVEDAYGFVRVRGELGRVVIAKSGHLYVDLKDEGAVIASVMWKGAAQTLAFRPEEGLEVVCEGRLSTFPGRSQYQLIVERMTPAGVGALMALLEERKKKLAAEGLFDPARKKPLPRFPEVVGVVTSPTGAVIRDILHRIAERFPRRVVVWPALVQGEKAAGQVAAAIAGFNALAPGGRVPRPDVLIVARGGGSIEDLWPFNEEVVVRAAAASRIPLISAVGHETDTTLIDHAADRRAPTPTGAAELVTTPTRGDLLELASTLGGRLARATGRGLEKGKSELRAAARGLPRLEDLIGARAQRLDGASAGLRAGLKTRADRAAVALARAGGRLRPEALSRSLLERGRRMGELAQRARQGLLRALALRRQRVADGGRRLGARAPRTEIAKAGERLLELARRARGSFGRLLRDRAGHVAASGQLLDSVSPKAVLARGYALVRDGGGGLVRRAAGLAAGQAVRLEFADGGRDAVIEGEAGRHPKRRGRGDAQGDLF